MCNPGMMMAMGAMQAANGYAQGRAADIAAQGDAEWLQFEGRMARRDADGQARRIRREGARARGEVVAATAASGVKVGEWSALDLEREVVQDYATDEYMALLSGERQQRAAELEAGGRRRAGRDARRAGRIRAMTSLMSSGAQAAQAGGWGQYGAGFTSNRVPAPVESRTVPRGG